MDKRVTKESFAAKREWERYIKNAEPKLSKGLVKSTLFAYCVAMAIDGTNGLGCYTSDATIARQLGMYDARAVRRYRHEALRLGWFVWTGEMKGRSQVLDIAIPEVDKNLSVSTNPVGNAEHDRNVTADRCAACRDNVRRAYDREMTSAQVVEIHEGLSASGA